MSGSWGSWGHRGQQWDNRQWWSPTDWHADSDSWHAHSDFGSAAQARSDSRSAAQAHSDSGSAAQQPAQRPAQQATNSETTASPGNAKTSRSLRRMSTDDGKEYCNRTYLGGEERTSLTREDRLKLAWAAIHSLEPDVEQMWKPQWIQRADLQVATGAQLDALIFLISRFQPATNLRTFKDLRPDTVREGARASYVSRQPEVQDRTRLMEEISQYRDHLDVLVRWAEYNHFQPGADPKAQAATSIKARAPRGQGAHHSGDKFGWLYPLPAELVWGEESDNHTPPPSQLLVAPPAASQRKLGRRSTDEDPPKRSKWNNVKVTTVRLEVSRGHPDALWAGARLG